MVRIIKSAPSMLVRLGMSASAALALWPLAFRVRLEDHAIGLMMRGTTVMSVIGWIVLGLIAGFIGSKIVNKTGQGMLIDIALGIVGAVVGGALFSMLGATGVTGFNFWSLIVAIIGSIVVLWIYHAVSGKRSL
jgi:uncharacterized membrane protein YeaQ/YmgE (transglycosylase-associated protein family)